MKEIKVSIKVIELVKLDFDGKDILVVKRWEDFLDLCRGNDMIYKVRNCYYLISDCVAWVYTDGKD